MDFWQWVTIIGLSLGFVSVAIGGVGVWLSARQTSAMTQQTGAITQLIAGAETRTQAILERMETNAEARYRDLKDRLDGEEAP
jgi:hypothetical protein